MTMNPEKQNQPPATPPATPPVKKVTAPKPASIHMTDAQRKELLKVKPDKKQVLDLFAKKLTIWQVTEAIYKRKFEHSDRRTWIFYQKCNAIRHEAKVPNKPIELKPLTTVAINSYLAKHTEDELRALLVR